MSSTRIDPDACQCQPRSQFPNLGKHLDWLALPMGKIGSDRIQLNSREYADAAT